MIPLSAQINRLASEKNIPQSVLIELTHDCNLQCYYCYVNKDINRRYLRAEEWKRVLSELSEAGCLNVTFSGGELFLNRDVFEILSEARRLAFAISVISNGTFINAKAAERLADIGLLDIGLSFHAAENKFHDILCGLKGSFKKTLRALRQLKSLGVNVAIKHTVSKANFGQFKPLSTLAKSEGVLFECDSIVVPHDNYKISPHALNSDEHKKFLLFMKAKPAPLICDGNPDANLHCDAGRSVAGVSPFGDVYPCIQLPIVLGNIRRKSFKQIWLGKRAKVFRSEEKKLNKECLSCNLKKYCGRCPGIAFLETGRWHGKAPSICKRTYAIKSLHQLLKKNNL